MTNRANAYDEGFDPRQTSDGTKHSLSTTERGTVFRKSQGRYAVDVHGTTVECTLSNRLRKQLLYPIADASSLRHRVVGVIDINAVDPVAIGDLVDVVPAAACTGMIVEVAPRRNHLSRRAAGPKPLEQVIVANADQFVPVMAATRPHPSWELLDRYLAAAEEACLPVFVVITKMDLADRAAIEQQVAPFREMGYEVVCTSATTCEGIEQVKSALTGKMSVVVGKSGVGKSSLLNALQPGLGLRVSEVGHGTNKGRHTTTHLERFPLTFGGSIVDTPGMREFGLWNVDAQELAHLFIEFQPHLGRCRFGLDCCHDREPGCSIRAAVDAGRITERRYKSYVRMAHSLL
ncbi:MAG: ribosome small subunit-dependent GTPase A [Chloroflexota bacterium]